MIWSIAAALSLSIVLLSAAFEFVSLSERGMRPPRRPEVTNITSKVVLFLVLTITLHAAIDPDHDRNTFELHAPQIARAVYAFASTVAVLTAFRAVRTWAGGAMIAGAVTVLEVLQWANLLPGHFIFGDWLIGLAGVAAAVGPIWLGGHRARQSMTFERRRD